MAKVNKPTTAAGKAVILIALQLISADPTIKIDPITSEIDLSTGERPTKVIGEVVRRFMRLQQYKKPQINILVNGNLFGVVTGGAFSISNFSRVNFSILKMLMDALFNVDQQLTGARTDNEVALSIAQAMGFKGSVISSAEYFHWLNEKQSALRLMAQFAKEDAHKESRANLPTPVIEWDATRKAESKLKRLEEAKQKLLASTPTPAVAEETSTSTQ